MHPSYPNNKPLFNYAWPVDPDTNLGKGAYGTVYEGFNKDTGKRVAIKVIQSAKFRPEEAHLTSILDHNNIIKLYDYAEDKRRGLTHLCMELGNGGNYQDYLQKPQNKNGVGEAEFLVVLRDMTSAMRYLRGLNIIHRDVKPGNIMRCITHDGRICCKLTDFGAARELSDEENFTSIHGTEEFLDPAVFMAYWNKTDKRENRFDANTDLWSLGATLHQFACGQVPFRPFGGARRNDQVMIEMFKNRPSGIVGGSQDKVGGAFKWDFKLPGICPINRCLREVVQEILKLIFDVDPRRRCNFETYFKFVEDLDQSSKIHVFCVPTSSYDRMFCPADASWSDLQKKMEEYFGISPQNQHFIYRGRQLQEPEKVGDLPILTSDRPLVMMSCDAQDSRDFIIPPTSKPPTVTKSTITAADLRLARICAGSMWSMKRSVEYITDCGHLTELALQWSKLYFKTELIEAQKIYHNHMMAMDDSRSKILSMTSQPQQRAANDSAMNNYKLRFQELEVCYATAREKFVEMSSLRTEDISADYDVEKASYWIESFLSYSQACDKVCDFLKKHERNNNAIFTMLNSEMDTLADICFHGIDLFRKDFRLAYKAIHTRSVENFRLMQGNIEQLHKLERNLRVDLFASLEKLQDDLSQQLAST